MLEVKFISFLREVNFKVFFSKDSLWESFNAFNGLKVGLPCAILTLLETDIVELLDFPAIVGVLVGVGCLPEVGLRGPYSWLHCHFFIGSCKNLHSFLIFGGCQSSNGYLLLDIRCAIPWYCLLISLIDSLWGDDLSLNDDWLLFLVLLFGPFLWGERILNHNVFNGVNWCTLLESNSWDTASALCENILIRDNLRESSPSFFIHIRWHLMLNRWLLLLLLFLCECSHLLLLFVYCLKN